MSYITYQVEVYDNGTKRWLFKEELHRTDGPAVEYPDGGKCWYLNDKRHRTDGPAMVLPDGTKYWYVDGKQHRTDGPAIEYADGIKGWFLDGKEYTKTEFNAKMNPNNCDGKIVEIDGIKYQLKSVE